MSGWSGSPRVEQRQQQRQRREPRRYGDDHYRGAAKRIASALRGARQVTIASVAEGAPAVGAGGQAMCLAAHERFTDWAIDGGS